MKTKLFYFLLLVQIISCRNNSTDKTTFNSDTCIYDIKDPHTTGWRICYFKNGNIRDSAYYKGGVLNGIKTSYDTLGNLIEKVSYMDGVRWGAFTTYYSNGRIKSKGFYENDFLKGWYYKYYIDGKLQSREEYVFVKGKNVNNQGEFFNEDGSYDTTTKASFIKVDIENDSCEIGDTIILKVELKRSYFKNQNNHMTRLIIANFDSNYALIDTLNSSRYYSDFYKFKHPVIPTQSGEISIRGLVFDDSTYTKGKAIPCERRMIYFTKKYFVRRRE